MLVAFGFWFMSLIPKPEEGYDITKTEKQSLPYLTENPINNRGKILAVVTSTDTMGSSGKRTGYELTELSRAYYVFLANGFEVNIASPEGGQPPVVLDGDDMGVYDYAFLNDPVAQQKTKNTLPIAAVDPSRYDAVYFVGGKGAMYDFPDNPYIQSMVSTYYESGKVIGAVCHGPAALVNVRLENGQPLLKGKTVSSFTNREELLLIPDAATIFPFLLEDRLVDGGARFKEGEMYLENVVQDNHLITGQNPWSTWKLAETMIARMGYQPKNRLLTPEENTIEILGIYHRQGYEAAKKRITEMAENRTEMHRTLLAMHSIVSAMQWKPGDAVKLIGLMKHTKNELKAAEAPNR